MKRIVQSVVIVLIVAGVFWTGVVVGQNQFGTPKTVLHVVSLQWKEDSTPAQQQRAIEGIKEMAATIPGIKNIWLSADRVQPREFDTAFAIEFESREAADAYGEHPAHDAWYEIYTPVRQQSRSLQITNR